TAERIGPVGGRPLEHNLDGVVVDALDAIDALVRAGTGRRRRRGGGVLPREDDVVGREWTSVVPGDATFQPPHDRPAVARNPSVGDARRLGGGAGQAG